MSWRAAEGVACLAFGRLSACSYVLTCLLVGALQAQTPSPAGAAPVPTQEAEAEPLRHKSRYFLWTELNLVGVYSSLSGEFDSTPRPQRTSVGFEFAGVLRDGRRLKRPAGGGVDRVRFDLHPLAIYDPIEDAF